MFHSKAGKKCFGVNKIEGTDVVKDIMKKAQQTGLLLFTLSVSDWVESTDAIGMYVKRGKYGGTFAHKDIAFEFASAILQWG